MTTEPETKTISIVYELSHPPAKVWRALTEPKLLEKWLMATDIQLTKGHTFTFKQPAQANKWWDGVVHCEILEVEVQKRLKYTWCSGPAIRLDTVVTWTLTPTPSGGTKLELKHSGFQAPSLLKPFNALAYYGAKGGWKRMVQKTLPAVLASL